MSRKCKQRVLASAKRRGRENFPPPPSKNAVKALLELGLGEKDYPILSQAVGHLK